MRRILRFCKTPLAASALWIAACFSLVSATYLSWVYRLMALTAPYAVDVYSMVIGYLLQAVGVGAACFCFYQKPERLNAKSFSVIILAFILTALPAQMGGSLTEVLAFGFLMQLACGAITGYYLCGSAFHLGGTNQGKAFGCGYGLSALFVFLLSLIGKGNFLSSKHVFFVYLALAALSVWLAFPVLRPHEDSSAAEHPAFAPVSAQVIWLALGTVTLMSLVKNLGFNFPSADIQAGANLELSRLFYAIGLAAAGFICDKNRKYGAVCLVIALVLPFVMQALSAETIPPMARWGLDYLFYGFFSVFRVVLFMDMSSQSGQWHLAALGLLAGRVGDALGTALYMGVAFSRLSLIGLTLALFVVTLVLFIRLCQRLYMPEAVQEKNEREVFESFSIQHDLSTREREVLRLVLAEQTIPQIAETLFVSESTVRYHVHNLLQKTGTKSRQEMVKKYNLLLYPQIGEHRKEDAPRRKQHNDSLQSR